MQLQTLSVRPNNALQPTCFAVLRKRLSANVGRNTPNLWSGGRPYSHRVRVFEWKRA
jgi:hypothetical protein